MFIGLISSLRLPNHYSLSNTVRTEWSLLFKGSTREIFTNTAVCWSHLFSAPSALTTFLITTVSVFSNMLTRGPRTERTQQCYVKTISTEFFFFFIKATYFLSNIKRIGLSSVLLPLQTLAFSSWVVSLHELLTQWMETRNVLRCTTFSSPTGIRL